MEQFVKNTSSKQLTIENNHNSAYFLFLLDFFSIALVSAAPTEVCSGCEARGVSETTGVFHLISFWWFVRCEFALTVREM